MLNLIINNTHPFKGNILPQKREMPLSSDSFICDFQEFSPNLHAFRVKDCTHELDCELVLEVKKSFVFLEKSGEKDPYLTTVVTCSFPTINLQRFNEKTGFDSYLQRLVMAQFQLNILEQLLVFCEQKDAGNLALAMVLSHLLEGCMVLRQIGLLRTHYAISSTKLLKEDWQAC